MKKLVEFLSGRKTYILALLGAVAGIVNFICAGDFSLPAVAALGKTEWVMALIAAIRAGISKSAPAK
jgi:hypothetical protein